MMRVALWRRGGQCEYSSAFLGRAAPNTGVTIQRRCYPRTRNSNSSGSSPSHNLPAAVNGDTYAYH